MIQGMIAKYAKKMTKLGYSAGDGHRILCKENERIYATVSGADFANIREEDIEDLTDWDITEKEVLDALGKMNAMIVSEPEYCLECIRQNRSIVAVLDDFAQIIGARAPVVDYSERAMTAALKNSAGILIRPNAEYRSGCAVTAGRDPYEAYVAMTVMEKSAEVFLKAEVLGGGRPLNPLKAGLERQVYIYKYSRIERKNKK